MSASPSNPSKTSGGLQGKLPWLLGGLLLILIVIVILQMRVRPEVTPSAGNYYTGPMRNKRGDLVTADGKVLEQSPSKTPNSAIAPGN